MTGDLRRRPVVVGADGSPSSLHAVRWAATEAARRQLPVVLLHACFVPSPEPYTPVKLPRSYGAALREEGVEILARAAKEAHAAAPEVSVSTEQEIGSAAPLLVRAAESAALLVVGSRGLGRVAGLLLGSVAVAIAGHASCPVVVVRGRTPESSPPGTDPVVLGLDGSPNGDAAVGFAFEAASARNVPLIAVHAAHRAAAELPDGARSQLTAWQVKYPQVELDDRVVRDRPVPALVQAAAEAQLLVAGSRGRGGFTGLSLGSTSQGLLHHAPCPVAIVRGQSRPGKAGW